MADIIVPASTSAVKKVVEVHPWGSALLVELLNPDEMIGTKLYVDSKTKVDTAPHAYIVELGPDLVGKTTLKPGDRVIVQGNGVAVTNPTPGATRKWNTIELHNIKAVVVEEAA